MANQENLCISTLIERVEQTIDGDNQSTSDSGNLLDTNLIQLQGDFNDSMSQDSLTNDDRNKFERPSSTTTNSKFSSKMSTIKSMSNGTGTLRSLALDQHIKLVKQKKEEAEILRLQKFQEQLRKKEQKWQQQQLERVKKWLQLRNRDIDHRTQVEERRKKREEEAKAKIDELIRREKEREQRVQHNRTTKPDNQMTMSIDISANRRAISASRLRSNPPDRRCGNDSSDDNSNVRDEPERRLTNPDRQHLTETIRRLAKPKNHPMSQSIHINALTTKTLPLSRSSHQLRMTTSTINRRQPTSRPATVPTSICSPSDPSKKLSTHSKSTITHSHITNSHSSSSISTVVKRSSQINSPLKSTSNTENELIQQIKSDDEQTQPIIDEQEYQRRFNENIRQAQQRLEHERQRQQEQKRQYELEEYEYEQEQIRFVNEQQRIEQQRLQQAIDECQRQNQMKQDEQLRQQQQREQIEREQAEENQRLNIQREEKLRQQEQERIERKKRLDLIMRRTRQISPTSKQEFNNHSIQIDINGHENTHHNIDHSPKSSITHSISDNRFPTSTSTDNFLLTNSIAIPPAIDLPKFKSPLIQSLLNKARSTRSTDNLIQTNLTSSQIINETINNETSRTKSTDLSQENGHNIARTIETTAATYQ